MIFDEKWLYHFSENYRELVKFLRQKQYLFYTKELEQFYEHIDHCLKQDSISPNVDIINYLDSKIGKYNF